MPNVNWNLDDMIVEEEYVVLAHKDNWTIKIENEKVDVRELDLDEKTKTNINIFVMALLNYMSMVVKENVT